MAYRDLVKCVQKVVSQSDKILALPSIKGFLVALVLCTGVDPVLLATRKLILERAGHIVVTATNERDLTSACKQHRFDVAVIGQTVSFVLRRAIASLVRDHCPSARILELYPPYQGRAVDNADSWLEVPMDVPQQLVARVNELAEEKRKSD